jgi:glutamate synthase (NADPH/NADH) small chain
MGKITGFMEFQRQEEDHLEPAARLKNYKEFVLTLSDSQAKVQGARCMDCGIPFCNTGCPVNNRSPTGTTWSTTAITARRCRQPAFDQQLPGIHRPHLPGALRIRLHAGHQRRTGRHQVDRAQDHRCRLGNGWIVPQPAANKTGKKVAVVGSGPAGLAAAQQLARAGHDVTVFEKSDRIGGLLRYGIPDFKMEKGLIDRRVEQMEAEGVSFRTSVMIGKDFPTTVSNMARETIFPEDLAKDFDAVVMAGGAEQPRDLPVPGRELKGVHFAMEFLPQQNRVNAGDKVKDQIKATGKHVVVIGGGDTGSDCVGTSNRHGAASSPSSN